MTPVTRWTATALLAALPLAGWARAVDVEIYDRTAARTLEIHRYQGERYVSGEPGHEYEIRLRNHCAGRVLAVTSVDGVNVVTGQTAGPAQSGYVLDAWSSLSIDGWRKSLADVAAFYFTALPDSYAARTGRPENVGVIGIALFRERARREPEAPAGLSRRERESAEDRAAPRAAAPSAAPSASGRADTQESAKLGTGHGERRDSQATEVAFKRATVDPEFTVRIYYDSHRNLVAQGVLPPDRGWPDSSRPDPFPLAHNFVPDP